MFHKISLRTDDIATTKPSKMVCYKVWQPHFALLWRHIRRDGVSNHQPRDCLLDRSFRRRFKGNIASLAFVWGIHRWPVNFPHKWAVTRKMFPFDDVIMETYIEIKEHPPKCTFMNLAKTLHHRGSSIKPFIAIRRTVVIAQIAKFMGPA